MAIILRPKHIAGLWTIPTGLVPNGDRTPERYRRQQAAHVAKNPATSDPVEFLVPIEAYVGGGAWRVECSCGEAPHADPEWRLSCCFGCGAIYPHVVFPNDWQAIEDLLSKRRVQNTRNWCRPETLDQLIAEQIARGEAT